MNLSEAAAESLSSAGLERFAPQLLTWSKPCIWLPTVPGEALSRVGGSPHLRPDFAWPTRGGVPLTFLAQIDLGSLPPCDLPKDGLLAFFFDRSDIHDGPPEYACVLHQTGLLEPRSLPAETEAFAPCSFAPRAGLSFPDLLRGSVLSSRLLDATADEWDALIDWTSLWAFDQGAGAHQLLGYPRGYQCDVLARGWAYEHGDAPLNTETPKAQRLLLQMQEDAHAGLEWVDAGQLCWLMHSDDLAAARFDSIWTVLEFS